MPANSAANGHCVDTERQRGAMNWEAFQQMRQNRPKHWLVEDMLPRPSITLAVGESTIGKTAYDIQLALCVAAGIPFLGRNVEAGPVLLCDLESGPGLFERIVNAQCRHLGLVQPPAAFQFILDKAEVEFVGLEQEITRLKPVLVVIDSLRSYSPTAEKNSETAASWMNSLKAMARRHNCSFFVVHHPRKDNEDREGNSTRKPLSESRVVDWMRDSAGSAALVNLVDVRLGVEFQKSASVDLLTKWNVRGLDDSGNTFLRRVCDDQGEPLGYAVAYGRELLGFPARELYDKLPAVSSYKLARMTCGKGDSGTIRLLREMITAGVMVHDKSQREYRKVAP